MDLESIFQRYIVIGRVCSPLRKYVRNLGEMQK